MGWDYVIQVGLPFLFFKYTYYIVSGSSIHFQVCFAKPQNVTLTHVRMVTATSLAQGTSAIVTLGILEPIANWMTLFVDINVVQDMGDV